MANEPTDSFLEVDENRQEENKNMPNVKFKRGLQSSLFDFVNHIPTIKSGVTVEDGTFYLTTDTNRLFVGNKKTSTSPVELVELNKSITTVATVDDLPTENIDLGQFYYIVGPDSEITNTKHANILAVWNGTTWIQVNPDTNTDLNDNTFVKGSANTAMVNLSGDDAATAETNDNNTNSNTRFRYRGISNGKAQYELVIEQRTSHKTSLNSSATDTDNDDIIAKFEIDIDSIISASSQVDIDNTEISSNKTTIKTTGAGSKTNGTGFTIEGSDRVILSDTSSGIKIDIPNYQLNSPLSTASNADAASEATINLGIQNGANNAQGTVTVKAGEDLAINNTKSNEFTIYHKKSTASAQAGTAVGPDSNKTPAAGATFDVPQVTIDEQGHVTALAKRTVQMPVDKDTKITGVTANSEGKIILTPSEGSDIPSGAVLYHTIDIYKADGTKNTSKSGTKLNQSSLGEFYDKEAIDKKLQGLDALTYKGTIGSSGATVTTLPAHPSNGDTYKVATVGTYGNNSNCQVGDLLIATGTEDAATGVIDSPTWTHIANGDDTDTTYTFGTSGTTIQATPQPSGTAINVATFEDGTDSILLAESAGDKKIKYSHKAYYGTAPGAKGLASNTQNLQHGGNFKVPYVTVDKYGHVTALDEHTVTLPAADLYSVIVKNKTDTASAQFVLKHNATEQDAISLAGSNAITITGDSTAKKFTITHNNISRTDNGTKDNTPTTTLTHNGKFKAITDITSNDQGHITGARFTEFTLPSDNNTTYELKSATIAGLAQDTTGAQLLLDATGGADSYVNITSQSLSIVPTPDRAVLVDLVWGSF